MNHLPVTWPFLPAIASDLTAFLHCSSPIRFPYALSDVSDRLLGEMLSLLYTFFDLSILRTGNTKTLIHEDF